MRVPADIGRFPNILDSRFACRAFENEKTAVKKLRKLIWKDTNLFLRAAAAGGIFIRD